ncbi:hypothetical protein RND71_029926 [Anisodus tanguticus]|uniref:F-box associated beta-propeller type 3 domain-containing protein n=1 Tax=Anisodus tanguticus TaxID=243964 RepID=A0AAE1RGH0_9SOLA|nr:hypothetical protein RND71_029926 [Anisodus tanguticus]
MDNSQLLFMDCKYLPWSNRCRLQFVSVDVEGKEETNGLYTVTIPDYNLLRSDWRVCSGLVCLIACDRIYLCNPAMRQVCELPKCSPSKVPLYAHFAFGYLHSKREYKVMHFFYRGPPSHLSDLQLAQLNCEVFSLNGVGGVSSGWKEIAEMPPCHPSLPWLLVNECMYWFAKLLPHAQPDRFVLFDFENEKYLTISRPSSFVTLSGLSMMDLKEMLCLPDIDRFYRTSILDLWILKDKISCTWEKECNINLVNFGSENITPSFNIWNEDIIFTHSGDITVVYEAFLVSIARGVNVIFDIRKMK